MPPTLPKARYRPTCVGVSELGRRSPSTTAPSASETTTIVSGVIRSYGTPEGFMTINPASRSMPLTLPNVP